MYNPFRTWRLKRQAKLTAPYLDQIGVLERKIALKDSVIQLQTAELKKLRNEVFSGQLCVENVLKRGINYFDPSTLPYADQVTYKKRADEVLRNETFINEVNHMLSDWMTFAARHAPDFPEVRDMRMCMSSYEVLRQRLEDIPTPRKKKGNTDPFDTV